ncbi:MAG: hypothetical protein KGJ59_02315 [Bacteroidota bacterium]|nr:hypothetical protein [Bacteroidota bacterium]
MRRFILILFFLSSLISLRAQSNSTKAIIISAGNVQRESVRLFGDASAWPIIVSLAERDVAHNAFILKGAALKQAEEFAAFHKKVSEAKDELTALLKNGARVFAPNQLDSATATGKAYMAAINNGVLDKAVKQGKAYISDVEAIGKLIAEKRNEAIDAILNQKNGDVDKKKGLLGSWLIAYKGDLFAESDGLKTGEASFAQLSFTDGCDVVVDPVTTVIIRKSRVDKLDQSVKRDIALEKGSLLTKLTAAAKEKSDFMFEAGTSASLVKSGKFWASASVEKNVKLSNYDGTLDVTASKVKVTVESNEGTIVEKGKPPLPPVKLLPPPDLGWSGLDTVIYDAQLTVTWKPINRAKVYQLEVCPAKTFNANIVRYASTRTNFTLKSLPLATTFFRMEAIDRYGLRGMDSPTYRIVRTKDTQPPAINIDGWETERRYTALQTIVIKGHTEPDAKFLYDKKAVALSRDGSFSLTVHVTPPETRVQLSATDKSGNTLERMLSVVPMDVHRVRNIAWNCKEENGVLSPSTSELSASGTAYPHVRVTAVLGDQHISVQTDSQGRWAISLKRFAGEKLTITFEAIDDSVTVATDTFSVQ